MKEKTNDIAKQSGSMVSSKEVSERKKKKEWEHSIKEITEL